MSAQKIANRIRSTNARNRLRIRMAKYLALLSAPLTPTKLEKRPSDFARGRIENFDTRRRYWRIYIPEFRKRAFEANNFAAPAAKFANRVACLLFDEVGSVDAVAAD